MMDNLPNEVILMIMNDAPVLGFVNKHFYNIYLEYRKSKRFLHRILQHKPISIRRFIFEEYMLMNVMNNKVWRMSPSKSCLFLIDACINNKQKLNIPLYLKWFINHCKISHEQFERVVCSKPYEIDKSNFDYKSYKGRNVIYANTFIYDYLKCLNVLFPILNKGKYEQFEYFRSFNTYIYQDVYIVPRISLY